MKSNLKKFLYIVFIVILVCVYIFFRRMQNEYNSITTYQECLDAGYPMLSTYPEQCKIPGKTFVNETQKASPDMVATSTNTKNYKNATYLFDGERITLINGVVTHEVAPGSASTETLRYFGNEVRGDFDGNGTEDIAFLITKSGAGSGTFYYVAVALLGTDLTYTGTNAVMLGDRIAPQTTELKNDQIVVNYADRAPHDPMTKKPYIGVSHYNKVMNHSLVEVSE